MTNSMTNANPSSYQAPLADMQFVMRELLDLSALIAACDFAEDTPDMLEPVLFEAAKLASEVLAPLNAEGDREGAQLQAGRVSVPEGFAQAYRQLADNGWLGISHPPEYGGQGLPELFGAAVSEMINAANMAFALNPLLTTAAIRALIAHAEPALQQRYLAPLIGGQWSGTMNLTEPQAGSDLSVIQTKAVPQADHYLISGQKIFITWGEHELADNIIHLVLARTPGAPAGVKGISLFLVPKYLVNADASLGARNDLRAVSLEHKLGIHASPTCVMSFGDEGGAVGYLVGEENQGLAHMFTMMNHARLGVGIQGVGVAERAYQAAVAYARGRVQGAAPGSRERVAIIRHPDVRRMLLCMRGLTEAARALCYLSAAAMDAAHAARDPALRESAQTRLDLLVPIAKGWSTESAQEVASLGVQVHGGMGYIEETGAAQLLRDARITTIYEGTTGIQALDLVGRKILRDGGAAFAELLAEIAATEQQLAARSEAPLPMLAAALRQGHDAMQQASDWLLRESPRREHAANAVAVNLLMLCGTGLGGWLLARSALIAHERLAEGVGDGDFYRAKLFTARFYAEQIMPRCGAYLTAILAGEESIMAEQQF